MRKPFIAAFAVLLVAPLAASAEDCPGNPDALGTARTIAVDPAKLSLIGTMSYPGTLKLAPKEVVLTFDDGPMLPMSAKVLETLRAECVKATYFLIGRNAKHFPEFVREIAKDGHSIGTHSQNHPLNFQAIGYDRGVREIQDGIRSVSEALEPIGQKPLPWFRFPGFNHTAVLDHYVQAQHMIAIGADFPADDWLRETFGRPDVVLARAMSRLEQHGSGILLLHDTQPATAMMLPKLLRTLKAKGYHVVQMVPAESPPAAEKSVPVAENAESPAPAAESATEPKAKPVYRFAHRRHQPAVQQANWWESALQQWQQNAKKLAGGKS